MFELLELREKHREKVRKAIARYLLVRCHIIIDHSLSGFGVLTHPITG